MIKVSDSWYRKQFPCPPDPYYARERILDVVEMIQRTTLDKVETDQIDDPDAC
jgi:hypothetical protein